LVLSFRTAYHIKRIAQLIFGDPSQEQQKKSTFFQIIKKTINIHQSKNALYAELRTYFNCRTDHPEMDENRKILFDEDTKLMRKVAQGDAEAFECLYYRFCPILRCLFARWGGDYASCDDFTQRVFTHLWEQRTYFREESSFLTYLLGIARHTLSEEIRQSRKTVKISLNEYPRFVKHSRKSLSEPETEFYMNEINAALERAKTQLTAEQQQAFKISHVTNSSCKASMMVGCSQEAHKGRLKRARKHLRELLASFL